MIVYKLHLAIVWVVVVGGIVGHCLGEGQAGSLVGRMPRICVQESLLR